MEICKIKEIEKIVKLKKIGNLRLWKLKYLEI